MTGAETENIVCVTIKYAFISRMVMKKFIHSLQ